MMRLFDYINIRLGLTRRHRRIIDRPLPSGLNYFFCLGGITFTLFLLQVLTGLLLSIHYTPSETDAYQSIQRLHHTVPLGQMLRSLHHWAANLMVVMVVLHMLRVFVTGSYKNPRELNWIAGAALLLITLAFGFTGYLLPWDQKAYWATRVGTDIAGSTPFIGHFLLVSLRGGENITGATLGRFFTLHVLVLPALIVLLLFGHFWMIRRQGISGRL